MPAHRGAGRLRHRLEVLQPSAPTEKQNRTGEPEPLWQPIAELWAAIEPAAGRKVWHGLQVQPDVTHLITLRYQPGLPLTTRCRLRLRNSDRHFQPTAVLDEDERHVWWLLTAIEEVK
jgi:head-tail adaptor